MYIWGKNRASGELIDTLPCSLCKKMIINAGLRRVIIMTKNGKINIFHIEDWATEWQYNDIIDDEKQDGESIKDLIQNKVVLEARPELGTEMIVEQVDNQPENKAEIFQPTEVVGFSESNSEPEFKPALELEKDFSNNQTLNHNSMDKKIIAVVGLSGSGKGSVVKILEDKNFKKIYFGEITFDEIQKRGLQLNEQNEKVVREDLRKKYGMAAFAILNIEKIRQAYSLGNVVIESMYSWQEYLKLKDEFGENFYVLAVQVGPNIRHQRLVNREEYQNGMKRTITLKEAQERDRSQIENLAIAGPIAIADYTIVNDGSFDELYAKLDQIVNKIIN
jgi:dephospho-CoA kinase